MPAAKNVILCMPLPTIVDAYKYVYKEYVAPWAE